LLGSGGIAAGGQAAGKPILPGGVGTQGVRHGFDDVLQLVPAAESQGAAGIPFPVFFAQLAAIGTVEGVERGGEALVQRVVVAEHGPGEAGLGRAEAGGEALQALGGIGLFAGILADYAVQQGFTAALAVGRGAGERLRQG